MVSKLDILSRYYQIYLEDIGEGYFVYDNKLYYLSDTVLPKKALEHYEQYLYTMQMQGFFIVRSCFGHLESEGHVLYTYEPEPYSIPTILEQSFEYIPDEFATLKVIKNSWCNIIDDARGRVAKYASRINHNEYYVILSYYYLGIAENVISIVNTILTQYPDDRLPLGYEHLTFDDTFDELFNPCNFIISTRIRDVAMAYHQQCISIDEINAWVKKNVFTELEVMYLYVRVLFPSQFFSLILDEDIPQDILKEKLIVYYQQIDREKQQIRDLYYCLSQYTYIPPIYWLMGEI